MAIAAVVMVGTTAAAWAVAPAGGPYDGAGVYDEVAALAGEHFYDEGMNGVDWDGACARRRPAAVGTGSAGELAPVVNGLLAELGASHTAFYPRGSRGWAELLDTFFDGSFWAGWPDGFAPLPVRYVGAGIVTRAIEGRVFVEDVYPGTPADDAGVLVGDEVVSVGGARWADGLPWPGGPGEDLAVVVRREPGGPEIELRMAGVGMRPDEVFAEAQRRSVRVVERAGARVACVRMRHGGGAYAELFGEQMRSDEIWNADALVLDLRGGWGGVPPDFITRFDDGVATFEGRLRGGGWSESRVVWRRPLVVLIDGGSRSGKEVFAHQVKASGRGRLVGERTRGAVLGGSPFPLPDGSVLYLAVMDVRVDGERLEGVGVSPDVEVPFELPYAAGADAQLEAALDEAARLVAG